MQWIGRIKYHKMKRNYAKKKKHGLFILFFYTKNKSHAEKEYNKKTQKVGPSPLDKNIKMY